MRLYIIRHADPDYDNNTITEHGHLEAKALAKRMSREGLTHIYSSPLGRALHTMQYTADATRLKPTIQEWFHERIEWVVEHGEGGTMMPWDVPGEHIRAQAPYPVRENWHELEPFHSPALKFDFDVLKEHSDAFLAEKGYVRDGGRYRCVKSNRERIAVFCHGGFGLSWVAHLLELPLVMIWSGFWMPPSSVTTILFDERSKDWAVPRCIGMSDVSHLYAEGLPVRPRGIKANFD